MQSTERQARTTLLHFEPLMLQLPQQRNPMSSPLKAPPGAFTMQGVKLGFRSAVAVSWLGGGTAAPAGVASGWASGAAAAEAAAGRQRQAGSGKVLMAKLFGREQQSVVINYEMYAPRRLECTTP